MNRRNELREGLASLRIEVPSSTRERHLAQITTAVRVSPPTRTTQRLGFRRRWATAMATLAMVVGPVGTAVAAEGSLPGELLYPMKQASETVRGIFDEDLAATHRIEELEALLDADAEGALIRETERRAQDAVDELDDPGELGPRLVQARERVRRQLRDGTGSGPGGGPAVEPGPGPGGPPDTEAPATTTTAPDGNQQQQRDRDRDGTGSGSGPVPTTGSGNDGGGSGDGSGNGSGSGSGSGGDGSSGSGSSGGGDSGNGSGSGGSGSGGAGGS